MDKKNTKESKIKGRLLTDLVVGALLLLIFVGGVFSGYFGYLALNKTGIEYGANLQYTIDQETKEKEFENINKKVNDYIKQNCYANQNKTTSSTNQ